MPASAGGGSPGTPGATSSAAEQRRRLSATRARCNPVPTWLVQVAKLIGAPPGYVGYGEGGKLTEAVR